MAITGFSPLLQDARTYTLNFYGLRPAVVATAADVTYAPAQVLGGFILRNTAGGARADKLPPASALVDAIHGPFEGMAFEFTIRNMAGAAEAITVTTNTGLTLDGTMTVAQNNSKRFLAVITALRNRNGAAADAVTVYSLGTVVH